MCMESNYVQNKKSYILNFENCYYITEYALVLVVFHLFEQRMNTEIRIS